MKKIITLATILATTPAFVFAGAAKDETLKVGRNESLTTIANKSEPHTAVPIMKDDKDHHDKKAHDTAHSKHVQKTQAEYVDELQKNIDEAKAFVEKNKSLVPAIQYDQASMKLRVAEEWLKAIKSYKDPITRYVRSFNYGMSELKSAKNDMKVRKPGKEVTQDTVKKGLDRLSKQSEKLLNEKKGVTFHEENDMCFNTMLKSSLEYITLANKPEYKANFKHLTKRARRYLSDATKFLKAHKSHESKHAKHDTKADVKTEVKADVKAEVKADVKPTADAAPASLGSSATPAATK